MFTLCSRGLTPWLEADADGDSRPPTAHTFFLLGSPLTGQNSRPTTPTASGIPVRRAGRAKPAAPNQPDPSAGAKRVEQNRPASPSGGRVEQNRPQDSRGGTGRIEQNRPSAPISRSKPSNSTTPRLFGLSRQTKALKPRAPPPPDGKVVPSSTPLCLRPDCRLVVFSPAPLRRDTAVSSYTYRARQRLSGGRFPG